MSTINKDVLLLDNKSLFSYLLVNKLWCETTVSILWSDPWIYVKYDSRKSTLLLNIILLHLPETSRILLTNDNINIIPTEQQNLSFNYIGFCKYIINICDLVSGLPLNKSQFPLLIQEIYKLYISKCTVKSLHSCLPDSAIHKHPKANACFSKLYELKCDTDYNPSFFQELAKT